MIEPTIGRVVWFHGAPRNVMTRFSAQPMAAQIAYVWNAQCVNLRVIDHAGQAHAVTSVYLRQPGDPMPTLENWCEWMPYQKGQAAKTEALEAAAIKPGLSD
jgi:hypothetical protein